MRTFVSHFTARSYEHDMFGHVNHAVYLNYFEQARFDAFEAAGYPFMQVRDRGWGVHVVRVEVDYRAEVRLGDRLEIQTRFVDFRRTSMVIEQRCLRRRTDGDEAVLAAEGTIVAVFVGANGRPARVPDDVRSKLGAPVVSKA
ncbi:MAG: acyl-CoA thioesterase [Gemmatimonadetes bacterium]|nr:MAG: acyl-CoA thioesterase [Gemmatimonadota bacterium]